MTFTAVHRDYTHTDPSGTIVVSKRFEGQAATGQDPYADDYFFYRYDIRGSVTTIVDGTGAVVKRYDYDEFGVTTSTGDAFHNEVTFTGSIADASGLLYMNARYYNPSTARFLSQDSYTGLASVPWTQHLYAYCNNNPVNLIDPTGHWPMRKNMVYINDGGGGRASTPAVTPTPEPTTTPTPGPQPGPSPDAPLEQGAEYWESLYGITCFDLMYDAVESWATTAREKSAQYEHYVGIYAIQDGENRLYFLGNTKRGTKNGVVSEFFNDYFGSCLKYSKLVGMAHTHPSPGYSWWHNDYPSFEDALLLALPGIEDVYLVPYSSCDGQSSIISISQPETYYHSHQYYPVDQEFYEKHFTAFLIDPIDYWIFNGRSRVE